MVSELSVHRDREGMADKSSLYYGGQETEKRVYRKGSGQDIATKDMTSVTYFLLLFTTSQ
jgi:hypothetical protein